MEATVAGAWSRTFAYILRRHSKCDELQRASLDGSLGAWTEALTEVVVDACTAMGWQAAAKGHPLDLLPQIGQEYLGIDVMAFGQGETPWAFPAAVIELENSGMEDRIAYSLWKVLCLRVGLRVVYCYRQSREECAALRRHLERDVLAALPLGSRQTLEGETLVVVGTRDEAHTFPYGFFKWFVLDRNTATLRST